MCNHEGCEKSIIRKGFCNKHYYAYYRKNSREFDVNDFWEFVKAELRLERR